MSVATGGAAGAGAGGQGSGTGGGAGAGDQGGAPPADPKLEADRAELATLRKEKADREKADADRAKAEKDKADAEALKRGEHEQLLSKEKAARETLEQKAKSLEIRYALTVALASEDLAEGALEDVIDALVKTGVKLGADGKPEDLPTKLEALKKAKSFYWAESAQDKTGGQQTQPPAGGLPGTNPKRSATGAQSLVDLSLAREQERQKTDRNPLMRKKGA